MTKKPHTKKANCNGNQMQMKLEIYIKKYIENTKSKNNRKILVLMLKN